MDTASRCSACHAPMRWARTEAEGQGEYPLGAHSPAPTTSSATTGRGMVPGVPWKASPAGPNPVRSIDLTKCTRSFARPDVLGPLDVLLLDPDTVRYMPHHATCTEWSKR